MLWEGADICAVAGVLRQHAKASSSVFLKLESLLYILEGKRDSCLFKSVQLECEELVASTVNTSVELLIPINYVLVGLLCLVSCVNRAEIREPLTSCKWNAPKNLVLKDIILVKQQHKRSVLEAGVLKNALKQISSLHHLVAKSAWAVRPQPIIVTEGNTKDNNTYVLKHLQPLLSVTALSTHSYELVPAVTRIVFKRCYLIRLALARIPSLREWKCGMISFPLFIAALSVHKYNFSRIRQKQNKQG